MDRRCVARGNLETAALGLASMYPAYLRSVSTAPGHHGNERAFELIRQKALKFGLLGSPVFDCAGKTGPPSRCFTLSQTSAGNRGYAGIRMAFIHFLARLKSAFPRPGHAPTQKRRAQGLSRRAVRSPRSGSVLIGLSTAARLRQAGARGHGSPRNCVHDGARPRRSGRACWLALSLVCCGAAFGPQPRSRL